uniref:NADH-ubiquinone oxidoreductase chain 5 n=1 Tax=Phyllomimus sp. YH-2018 TaxID=2100095 RepID=A0A343UWB7_9ORTH|nr:NADH dehydrogenase subunit 5 [Phyllomimus sp. YH-2018]
MFWWLSIDKISSGLLLIVSLVSMVSGGYFMMYNYVVFFEWELFTINSLMVIFSLLLDWMSLMFMGLVMFISSLVVFYSGEYMEGDVNMNRFISLVLLFVFSMVCLIVSPNIISILLGWDGLGLVSYCLVIYYQNLKSYSAGMLTALSNRIGDVALLMGIAWMVNVGGWSFVYYLDFLSVDKWGLVLAVLVVLAAFTKSAQIPFSSWLPAAMAAPTPVSALVHSSTLVTAGVYLLIRFDKLIMIYDSVVSYLMLISMLTMFMSGIGANLEYDLKKIIALSTLSQLGLMVGTLAVGESKLAFFHLLTHALFKALLFMCAGVIIHNMMNCQDIRCMGGLSMQMPITASCFNIANLALCGMPFLAGYYSKDLILEHVILSEINICIFFLFMISTGLTVCYSLRLSYYTMTGEFNVLSTSKIYEERGAMLNMMLVLMMMAVMGGCSLGWALFSSPMLVCLPWFLKFLVLGLCIIGGVMGYLLPMMFSFWLKSLDMYGSVVFLGSMWFMPLLSTRGMNKFPLEIGGMTLKVIDQGWSEEYGGQNLYSLLISSSQVLQWLQDNSLKFYLLSFILWVVVVVFMGFINL